MAKASEWKARGAACVRAEAEELVLPSGQTILARRPNAVQLAVWGRLPLQLVGAVIGGGQAGLQLSAEDSLELAGFYRDLLIFCCVEPRISLNPVGEGEIHPKDVPGEDWQFIIRWAMRFEEGRDLEGFRGERAGDGGGGGGEDVGGAAEPVTGDGGPGVVAEF
jgi:hypothetical protein